MLSADPATDDIAALLHTAKEACSKAVQLCVPICAGRTTPGSMGNFARRYKVLCEAESDDLLAHLHLARLFEDKAALTSRFDREA
jgi:hypothetical protein